MSLPTLTPPPGVPDFLVVHAVTHRDVFANLERASGHRRKRRLRTSQLRAVDVAWLLTAEQMTAVDAWFEDDLLAGARPFSARLAAQGPGLVWWEARWAEPYEATPEGTPSGIVWHIVGRLILSGDPSTVSPLDGDIALEVSLALLGTGTITASGDIALEVTLPLLLVTTDTALEVTLALVAADAGEFLLTEDDDPIELESGGEFLTE